MKKETLATGGVLGLSFLIASCCIGPTLFLLLGVSVSVLGVFSGLEPYQPYFIGAGVLALGFAGHRIFRPAKLDTDCADGACAPDSRSRRFTRRFFVMAVVLFAVAAAYPYVLNTLL
jgi:mercuric ion transport protein